MTNARYTEAQMAHEFAHTRFARLLIRGLAPDGRPTTWKRHYFGAPTYQEAAVLAYAYAGELDKAKRADADTGWVCRAELDSIPNRRRIELMDRKRSGVLTVPETVSDPIVHGQNTAAPAMPHWSDLEV